MRAAVLVQHPPDLDTAIVLAQLQDEVAPIARKKEFRKFDYSAQSKLCARVPLPLPAPPRQDRTPFTSLDIHKSTDVPRRLSDDRWKALRAQRRAQGLCQFCAEKWFNGHSCVEKIHLHAVQELLEVFELPEDTLSPTGNPVPSESLTFPHSLSCCSHWSAVLQVYVSVRQHSRGTY